jgi:predicted small secreted protein
MKEANHMARTLTRLTFITTLMALSACGTVRGIGHDLSAAGQAISKTAS